MKNKQQKYFHLGLLLTLMIFLMSFAEVNAQNSEPVNAIAWSPDGTMIAIGGGESGCDPDLINDFAIRILNASNSQLIKILSDHWCRIISLAWSPDGTMIASSSIDRTSNVWDVGLGELIATTTTPTLGRNSLVWSPDGTMIADVWIEDFRFEIWNPTTGQSIRILENPNGNGDTDFVSLSWSPDSTKIVSGSFDNLAYIWDVTTDQIMMTLSGHTDIVRSVAWSPDGTMIATGSYDGTLRVWNANTGMLIDTMQSGNVFDLAWHPSSQLLASAILDSDIRIWNVSTGQEIETIPSTVGRVEDMAWSPDGSQFTYVGSYTGINGENLQILPAPSLCDPIISTGEITELDSTNTEPDTTTCTDENH